MTAQLLQAHDYYSRCYFTERSEDIAQPNPAEGWDPFGSPMPGRNYVGGEYRFGFQGQETDNEVRGNGNSVAFKYRVHDPRIGRFASVDPLGAEYPFYSPYAFSGNRVIDMIEREGLEPEIDDNGNWTGRYKVMLNQGPSYIAKDMNDNYRQLMNSKVRWEEIVDKNYTTYFSHITEDIYNASNPQYSKLNMNAGDFIDLSFMLSDKNSSYIPLETSFQRTEFKTPLKVPLSGIELAAGVGAGVSFLGLTTDEIPLDWPVWEGGRQLNMSSTSFGYTFPGASLIGLQGKLKMFQIENLSLTETINNSFATSSELGAAYGFGVKHKWEKGINVWGDRTYKYDLLGYGVSTPVVIGSLSDSETSFGSAYLKEPMNAADSTERADYLSNVLGLESNEVEKKKTKE